MRSNRCMICETWWSPDRRICGCCGNKLRSKPRFKKMGVQRMTYQQTQLPREIWLVSKSI